jgi:hypothetical protein
MESLLFQPVSVHFTRKGQTNLAEVVPNPIRQESWKRLRPWFIFSTVILSSAAILYKGRNHFKGRWLMASVVTFTALWIALRWVTSETTRFGESRVRITATGQTAQLESGTGVIIFLDGKTVLTVEPSDEIEQFYTDDYHNAIFYSWLERLREGVHDLRHLFFS